MTEPNSSTLSHELKQGLLFFLGLGFTFVGYFALQILGVLLWFFTYCCGASGDQATLSIGAVCVALHVGILCFLFRKRVLYTTWLVWAVNVGLVIGLFTYLEFYHTYQY